jgi:hypothetical protein
MYKEFVKDFADRTRKNLEFIEKGQPEFKITQLVNSCLGLIAFPRKECFDQIPQTLISDLDLDGWSIPNGFRNAPNLKKLIRHLRNSVTHGHLKFSHDDKYEIVSLIIWDENKQGKRTWDGGKLSVEELREFVIKFSDSLINGSYCSKCPGCPE